MPDLVNIIGLENCQEDKHGIFKEGVDMMRSIFIMEMKENVFIYYSHVMI